MTEFFVVVKTNAAPFLSDTLAGFEDEESPEIAIVRFFDRSEHPAGFYSGAAWANENDYHKGKEPVAVVLSDRAQAKEKCSFCGDGIVGKGAVFFNDHVACSKVECHEKFDAKVRPIERKVFGGI
jgi:hypothetical protein